MGAKNYGLLLVMMEPSSTVEEEFNEWYDTEHVPTRLSVHGFLSSERYIVQEGYPKYLALFDLESPGVLKSDEYIRVSGAHPSPWSRRMFRHIRGTKRNVYEQTFPGNSPVTKESDGLLLIAEDVDLSKEEEISQWYVKEHIPCLRDIKSVISVRRFICIEGSPKYLSLYEIEEVDSLKDDDCKQVFKERTSKLREFTKNVRRNVYKKYRVRPFDHIKFFT